MSGDISHLFNQFLKDSAEKKGASEDMLASATFYMEPSSTQRLFDLIKRHGNFRIKTIPLGYEAQLGKRRFNIIDSSEFIELSLHQADALSQESADVTAELASILLPNPDKPLKLQASNVDDERRLFEGVRKFFPKLAIRAFNENQRLRFEFLEEKKRQETIGVGPKNTPAGSNPNPAGLKLTNMMGGFLKADEFGYKVSSIYVESDTLGFLLAFAKEEGEIVIESFREHFRFLLRGMIISLDNYSDLSRIQLLSPLSFGAIGLMFRIGQFLYGDLADKSPTTTLSSLPSAPLTGASPENTQFFGNFINNPALLERNENIINPNYLFHPRNLYNPSNPRSPIRLRFEAMREDDEKLILSYLEKHASYPFRLFPQNEAQGKRISAYLQDNSRSYDAH